MTVAEREARAGAAALTQDELLALAADTSPRVRRVVAGRNDLSAAAVRGLVGDPDRQVRENLARNPVCPVDVLARLMDDDHWRVRWDAAQNRSPDPAVREAALSSPRDDVRTALAQMRNLALEASHTLAHDPHLEVRRQLASSSRWPEILAVLAADPSPRIRAHVAGSRHASEEVMRHLATDKIAHVRAALAPNPAVPADLLLALARDRSTSVRRFVMYARRHDPVITAMLREDHDRARRKPSDGNPERPSTSRGDEAPVHLDHSP